MTSGFVRDFYRAIDAGTLAAFYRNVDMWWAPVVEHPQHIPPIQGASTWKDLYVRHPTFMGLQERHAARHGQTRAPLLDMATWEARHGDQYNRRSKDTCFKCGQPGHWANKCNQAGPVRDCKCGQPCAIFLTRKDGPNKGKRFFKCPTPGSRCPDWVGWVPAAGPPTPSQPPPPSPSQPPPPSPSQPPPLSPSQPPTPSPSQPPPPPLSQPPLASPPAALPIAVVRKPRCHSPPRRKTPLSK